MIDDIDAAFKQNTTMKRGATRTIIKCKKGLFSVSAPSYKQAMKEARHYFRQYYIDGEYNNCESMMIALALQTR